VGDGDILPLTGTAVYEVLYSQQFLRFFLIFR